MLGLYLYTLIISHICHKKTMPEPGIEPETSCTQSGCVTTAPPSQLRVSIVN